MKICIAGKNDIATECTDFLLSENHASAEDVLVCFNTSDDGTDSFQRSFRKYCRTKNIEEVILDELYQLQDLIFISLEFEKLISPSKFSSTHLFNIHFSLLPKYKGMYTSAWPILNGETDSGVTLHKIDAGIDTGDIIDQTAFPIGNSDSCRDLYLKYIQHGIDLFKANITSILNSNFRTTRQSAIGSSYYSKASLDFASLEINLNKTAFEIRNQIRAFNFREYQIPEVHGSRIISADLLDSKTNIKSGTILKETDTYIDISTIDYDLRLVKNGCL